MCEAMIQVHETPVVDLPELPLHPVFTIHSSDVENHGVSRFKHLDPVVEVFTLHNITFQYPLL